MKKLLLILLCLPLIGVTQNGELTFCSDTLYSESWKAQQTIDGGFAAINAGGGLLNHYTYDSIGNIIDTSIIDYGPILIKIDANLDTSWTQNNYSYLFPVVGGIMNRNAIGIRSFQQTSDGGYILCGGEESIFLIKTDVYGDQLWSKSFYNICPYPEIAGSYLFTPRVIQTFDGGYMITGTHSCNSTSSHLIFLIKTDSNGVLLWETELQGSNGDYATDIEQTIDGGYIISGHNDNGGFGSPILLKTDQTGNLLWLVVHPTGGAFSAVEQTIDLGYIVAGELGNNMAASSIIKTDQNGNELFTSYVNLNRIFDVKQTPDGGYICTGDEGDWYFPDMSLVKTDAGGSTTWQKNYGGPDFDMGMSVENIMSGGYIIAGHTSGCPTPDNGIPNLYIVRTDGSGNITSTNNISENTNKNLLDVIDVLGRKINEKQNTLLFYIYDDGTVEKRMVIE